jgi:diacylglycerol O-acyltransferase
VDPVALARTSLQTGRALLPLLRESMFGREDDAPPRPTLPFAAPRTAFNNAISSRRVTAFGKTNLETVKAVRKAFDCKVNDVVLAACTMSLRRYLEAHHDLPAESLVASVPVSVRPESAGEDLGNRVSTMFVGLPVHVADPLEQLEIITEDSRRAKELRSSFGDELLRDWAELAPPRLFEEGARLWGNLKIADRTRPVHNLVISNVPGPPMPFYAGGARVVGIYPFGPILEGAGMNITVFSTQGSMDIGVIACPRAVADPWDIVRGFEQAVEELAELATTGGKLPRRVEDREQRAREMSFRRTPRREVS